MKCLNAQCEKDAKRRTWEAEKQSTGESVMEKYMQKIERSWKDFQSCIMIKILFITSNIKVTMFQLAISNFFNTVLKPCVVMFIQLFRSDLRFHSALLCCPIYYARQLWL